MVKNVLNFIFLVVILAAASWIAPGSIYFGSLRALILVAGIMYVVEEFVLILCNTPIAKRFFSRQYFLLGDPYLFVLCSEATALGLADIYMSTVSFGDNWTVYILAATVILLRIPVTNIAR
ncbi:hypothetical protein J6X90_02090 [Candidatus Saccharibacteria bacterium]|nr:hypothetical protein [Candidatus Saccharibacteria bacterium]